MLNRYKHSWTHNELFAHKKNTGEEAKLRDKLFRLEKKFGIVNDFMRHEVSQVRSSLKCLRRSTGHSIDALPPTPFQLRENTFVTFDWGCNTGRSKTDIKLNSTRDGLVGTRHEVVQIGNNDVSIDEVRGRETTKLHGDYSAEQPIDNYPKNKRGSFGIINNNLQSDNTKNDTAEVVFDIPSLFKESRSPRLPEIENEVDVVNARQGRNNDHNIHKEHGKDRTLEENENTQRPSVETPITENYSHSKGNKGIITRTELASNDFMIENENEQHLDYIKSRDNTQYLFPKTRECTTLTDFSDMTFPTSSCSPVSTNIPINSHHANNNISCDISPGRRREKKREPTRKTLDDKGKMSQLRNTRTRCRTCLERYRQNIEFQRQKKLLEQDKAQSISALKSIPITTSQDKPLKSFLAGDDDLNALFDETEVLDFEETTTLKAGGRTNGGSIKKGFSKSRLQQLAEPRNGRRKRVLFSKQLIKKEVDCLTEKHSQPHLTEREKERLRVLESKIRMFLAVTSASGEVIPSSMVHIPQREDVMTVDISHL